MFTDTFDAVCKFSNRPLLNDLDGKWRCANETHETCLPKNAAGYVEEQSGYCEHCQALTVMYLPFRDREPIRVHVHSRNGTFQFTDMCKVLVKDARDTVRLIQQRRLDTEENQKLRRERVARFLSLQNPVSKGVTKEVPVVTIGSEVFMIEDNYPHWTASELTKTFEAMGFPMSTVTVTIKVES